MEILKVVDIVKAKACIYIRTNHPKCIIISWVFCKYDSKLEVKHKINPCFFGTLICIFHPKFRLFTKMSSFFFFKMHILLYHTHLPQVFTILSLPSIHQPPWTTNLKLLMHLKINLHSFFLNSYEAKKTFLYFLSIFIQKKPKNLILKILWFKEPLKLTILGG